MKEFNEVSFTWIISQADRRLFLQDAKLRKLKAVPLDGQVRKLVQGTRNIEVQEDQAAIVLTGEILNYLDFLKAHVELAANLAYLISWL